MGSFFTSWMMNPLMLAGGALAVSIPIIIHLLNKRRFKIVDWAAMDFLFDADKKNRRRVKVENLILLLMRCLIMLLIGLMLARPFFDTPAWLASKQRVERIVVLDDSLSMKVVTDNTTGFEHAKLELKKILKNISSDDKDDTLTLFVTSQPDRPLLSNEPVTSDTIDAVSSQLDDLEINDGGASYREALQSISQYVSSQQKGIARVLYVFSDLRTKDWGDPEQTDPNEETASKLLSELSQNEMISDCIVVDAGSRSEDNLAITEVKANDLQVVNADISFTVTVTNFGRKSAKNVRVRFRNGENAPQSDVIDSIAPGASSTVNFNDRFNFDPKLLENTSFVSDNDDSRLTYQITAEIVRDGSNEDVLTDDNLNYYPSNALKAIPVLTVNGDPSSKLESNETYILDKLGKTTPGIIIDSVTINQFLTTPLSKYKVIFLCNVDAFSEDRMNALEQWVKDGGGLVIMPGNRVRASEFNSAFYNDGKGLSPIRLKGVAGDATKATWVNATVADPNHPAAKPIEYVQSTGLSIGVVSIFSWWNCEIPTDEMKQATSIILQLTDKDQTPLMCEREFGRGRVVTFSVPVDGDWSNWNSLPALYVLYPLLADLPIHLMGNSNESFVVPVGGSIEFPVELSRYETEVALTDPADEKTSSTAKPIDDSEKAKQSLLYQANFSELLDRGFYRMSLKNKSGETDDVLFAVNVDAGESDLKRLSTDSLNPSFFGENTQVVNIAKVAEISVSNPENEIWFRLLIVLLCILGAEQFLGWWFGRKR